MPITVVPSNRMLAQMLFVAVVYLASTQVVAATSGQGSRCDISNPIKRQLQSESSVGRIVAFNLLKKERDPNQGILFGPKANPKALRLRGQTAFVRQIAQALNSGDWEGSLLSPPRDSDHEILVKAAYTAFEKGLISRSKFITTCLRYAAWADYGASMSTEGRHLAKSAIPLLDANHHLTPLARSILFRLGSQPSYTEAQLEAAILSNTDPTERFFWIYPIQKSIVESGSTPWAKAVDATTKNRNIAFFSADAYTVAAKKQRKALTPTTFGEDIDMIVWPAALVDLHVALEHGANALKASPTIGLAAEDQVYRSLKRGRRTVDVPVPGIEGAIQDPSDLYFGRYIGFIHDINHLIAGSRIQPRSRELQTYLYELFASPPRSSTAEDYPSSPAKKLLQELARSSRKRYESSSRSILMMKNGRYRVIELSQATAHRNTHELIDLVGALDVDMADPRALAQGLRRFFGRTEYNDDSGLLSVVIDLSRNPSAYLKLGVRIEQTIKELSDAQPRLDIELLYGAAKERPPLTVDEAGVSQLNMQESLDLRQNLFEACGAECFDYFKNRSYDSDKGIIPKLAGKFDESQPMRLLLEQASSEERARYFYYALDALGDKRLIKAYDTYFQAIQAHVSQNHQKLMLVAQKLASEFSIDSTPNHVLDSAHHLLETELRRVGLR